VLTLSGFIIHVGFKMPSGLLLVAEKPTYFTFDSDTCRDRFWVHSLSLHPGHPTDGLEYQLNLFSKSTTLGPPRTTASNWVREIALAS
jgi:hypothetical protein